MQNVIEIGDQVIAYTDNGKLELPSILFIHGNSHSSEVFANQFEGPLNDNFRLVALDLPGHGKSSKAQDPGTYSLITLGRIIASVVKILELKDVVIAGHSLGGHIALEASLYLPDLRGVFIWGCPPIKGLEDFPAAFRSNEAVACLFKENLTDSEVELIAKACYADDYKDWQQSIPLIKQTDPLFRKSLAEDVQKQNFNDERAISQRLAQKLKIVHGNDDKLIGQDFFGAFDDVTYLKNIGHSLHLEAPKMFQELLYNFALAMKASTDHLFA